MRHEHLAEHLRRNFTNFLRRPANLNPALESILESSFAPSARVNLCFNDNIDIAQLTCDLLSLVEGRCDSATRGGHIELLQQLFGLMFLDVHREDYNRTRNVIPSEAKLQRSGRSLRGQAFNL